MAIRPVTNIAVAIDQLERRVTRVELRRRGYAVVTSLSTYAQPSAPTGNIVTGAIWYDTANNNTAYRWDGSNWVPVIDPSVDAGRDRAAFDLVSAEDPDGSPDKLITTRILSGAPAVGPVGDLWIDSDDNHLYRSNGVTWVDTGDTTVGASVRRPENASTIADGRITTWWQNHAPTPLGIGDLWVSTGESPYRLYRWNNFNWVQVVDWSTNVLSAEVDKKTTTFQQDTPPVSTAIGDVWFDTSDDNKQYRAQDVGADTIQPDGSTTGWVLVQDQGIPAAQDTANQAQTTANTKTQAFYQGRVTTGVPAGVTVGDIWFDTDENNHSWFWDGAQWVDAQNPNIDAAIGMAEDNQNTIQNNVDAINNINNSLDITQTLIENVHDTATSADGRVVMSDDEPDDTDVAGKSDGSVWFTRTRARANLCTNPSFETNLNFWSMVSGVTSTTRVTGSPALDGSYQMQIVNDASANEHVVAWGVGARQPCAEGSPIAVSVYAYLVSGTQGSGSFTRIAWYDSAGTRLTPTEGTPVTLTGTYQRLVAIGTSPVGAASFQFEVVSPANNTGVTWVIDAALIEQDDDLGRYFDGDAYDSTWRGVANNSVSDMVGGKISRIFELYEGSWQRRFFTEDALTNIDASKLKGTIDPEIIADGSIRPDKMYAPLVLASEALLAGDLVNVWNNNGVSNVRKAVAQIGYEAHGYVLDSAGVGGFVSVYHNGYNPFVMNLVPGPQWLSATAGQCTSRSPSGVGNLVQRVGFSPSSNILDFNPQLSIRIT